MANTKDNLSKYATSFIDFDELSGNAIDSIGGYIGTLVNTPTRVAGWNGEGYAMSFDGVNQYVQFDSKLIPVGDKTIRFKFKTSQVSSAYPILVDTRGNTGIGMNISLTPQSNLYIMFGSNSSTSANFLTPVCNDGVWHTIMIQKKGNIYSFFFDNMTKAIKTSIETTSETHTQNLTLGKNATGNTNYFNGQLDQIEIYDRAISPIPDKYLVFHDNKLKYHDGASWQITTETEDNFIQYGMDNLDHITEVQWKQLAGDKSIAMWSDFEDKEYASVVLKKDNFIAKELLGDTAQAIYYTDSDASQIVVETEVEPFSVYDHISDAPEVLVYTESTDDIIVSTTTEPFEIYDEFGDSVEVLYYTDDETTTNADLILEANWSPIDELEGDFEVVTWTDEPQGTAQRVLEMTAIPKPQFVKLTSPKRVYGQLESILVNDVSLTYRFLPETRYFVSGLNSDKWYVWDEKLSQFVVKDTSTEQAVSANGMSYEELNKITDVQWSAWKEQYLNIGIFLKDNPRDTKISIVDSVSYEDIIPRHTQTIEDTSLYILNTTAKIDISFNGNVLQGILSDNDLTRVQYRVLINGNNYYPSDGSFTKLGESPQNIEVVVSSKDIKIDDWNTIRIEFQDFFGTTDYWQNSFMGTYSGLMFKDVFGQYYSNEIGEVLQYLDFGIIIAGQTTIEHEIILKNQYGYDIKNVHLTANTANFPQGITCEFSTSLNPFSPQPDLRLGGVLNNNKEISFFIRLKTELGVTPDVNGSFDIIVRADKA